ncbi:MAG: Gfo/Idh/MocA family oxidoreductase [Acidobacteriota bacterium]
MKCLIVGLGIQGRKRLAIAGADAAGTVDPIVPGADWRSVEEVPLDAYDAALVCTPDAPKLALLTYLLGHGKHVLVEKPLLARDAVELQELGRLARQTGAACYTAYNHRFEPHLVSVKDLLDRSAIGQVYQARFFYGNGTARDVRNSPWRDRGLGVIPDLASHMFDLVLFFFGQPAGDPEPWAYERFENAACDYFLLGFPGSRPMLRIEGTLLSWRNSFFLDIVGELGSIHVTSLCKWGPTSLIVRDRKLPSGKPDEQVQTLEQPDPTWALEYDHFKSLCAVGGTNLDHDVWISRMLNRLAIRLGTELIA